jgi:hypothetical protein
MTRSEAMEAMRAQPDSQGGHIALVLPFELGAQ